VRALLVTTLMIGSHGTTQDQSCGQLIGCCVTLVF
jgi:hypothetical protein